MPPSVTLLTPTADQPTGFLLCEAYMARQTVWGALDLEWLVVDDGDTPCRPTLGQTHLRRERPPGQTGARSLCENLLAGTAAAQGDVVIIIEHDDWYAPQHLESMLWLLSTNRLAGDGAQRYYNLPMRRWRVYPNKGACLCQTGFQRCLTKNFERTVRECLEADNYGIDGRFWGDIPREYWALASLESVCGIKGLPGRAGLGVGHRPTAQGWTEDPLGAQLRAWVGPTDAAVYEAITTLRD